jgi:hypothetical protein
MTSYHTQMDALLRTIFKIPSSELHDLLNKTGCFIAGGAAVHLLMGKPVEEFDGDLDIWFPGVPHKEGDCDPEAAFVYHSKKKALNDFMARHNRLNMHTPFDDAISHEYNDKDNCLHSVIRSVVSYNTYGHRAGKYQKLLPNVQVISAFGDRDQILNSFDFSFCAVGYDPKTGELFGKDLELTKKGEGYVLNEARNDTRRAERLAKYQARGFRLNVPKKPKEYVNFMDEIETFYAILRDDNKDGRLEVEDIRQSIHDLLKKLDEAPRV